MHFRTFLIPLILIFSSFRINAQTKDSVLRYPIVLKFQSKCCGVPDQKPLDSAILLYKINNHIRAIKADKISPMGREGEYYLAFKKTKFMSKHKKTFLVMLKAVVKKMKEPGYVEIEVNSLIRKEDLPSSAQITNVIF